MMFPKGNYRQARKRRARLAKPKKTEESALQAQCEAYLDLLNLQSIRIPDEMNKAIFAMGSQVPVYIARKISSYTKGVPDLTVLFQNGRYVCIELKSANGKQSVGQKEWSAKVIEHYYVVRDFDRFKKIIDERK